MYICMAQQNELYNKLKPDIRKSKRLYTSVFRPMKATGRAVDNTRRLLVNSQGLYLGKTGKYVRGHGAQAVV